MIELNVEGMSCGHCVSMVTKAVKAADPGAQVDVDLASHKVRVETSEDRKVIASAIAAAGYPAV